MIRNIQILLISTLLSVAVPQQAEASIFSKALSKARNVMQSAFQMTFLNKLPVIFYKDSFDTMFEYTNKSIENLNIQNDKKLHITKSATSFALRTDSPSSKRQSKDRRITASGWATRSRYPGRRSCDKPSMPSWHKNQLILITS